MRILTALILTLMFTFSAFAQRQVKVIVTSTYIRKSPDQNSEKVLTVQKGDTLTLNKRTDKNGWYYVSVSKSTAQGWIRMDTVSTAVVADIITRKPQKGASIPNTPANKTSTVTKETAGSKIPSENSVSPVAESSIEDEEVISVETEEVILNARVVDSNNRVLTNLSQSQFKVYEDNVLQTIVSFGTTEIPIINALVIDNSRSLRSQLQNIIEAGKIIVVANRLTDESAIIRFVSTDKIEVVQDFTLNKGSLIEGLDNLFVEGGQTSIIDAVHFAAKKVEQYKSLAEKDDRLRAIILVSDGDDRSSSYNEEQLFELLRKSRVQIYAIGLVSNLTNGSDANGIDRQKKAKAFLTRLTEETGGKVYFPNSTSELPQIASDISGKLHTQYLISYTPTNEKRDGTFRKIQVFIDDGVNKEKRIAIARTGRISAAK